MKLTKDVDLGQLQQELAQAGVSVPALGTTGSLANDTLNLYTYDEMGAVVDLPASASAVVAAHNPPAPPPRPNFGTDTTAPDQVANAVQQLRTYLAVDTPTQAQNAAALKVLIRVVLWMMRSLRLP